MRTIIRASPGLASFLNTAIAYVRWPLTIGGPAALMLEEEDKGSVDSTAHSKDCFKTTWMSEA
jgi:hypothetical protein